jgi:hypothetical protein
VNSCRAMCRTLSSSHSNPETTTASATSRARVAEAPPALSEWRVVRAELGARGRTSAPLKMSEDRRCLRV